jgi:hypothetical protein
MSHHHYRLREVGAHKDAAESFLKAEKLLQQAEAYKARKAGTKPVAMTARELRFPDVSFSLLEGESS